MDQSKPPMDAEEEPASGSVADPAAVIEDTNPSRSPSQDLAKMDRDVESGRSESGPTLIAYIRESWYAHAHAGYLASLRILVGALFLTTAIENLQKGLYGAGFRAFVQSWATGNPIDPYRRFLEYVVIPNWQAFSTVQLIVEPVVMGLFLMIGLFTRASASVAAFFIANLFLASLGREWPWTYLVILGVLVTLIFSRAGRYFGIDQFLAERYPDPPVPLW